MVDEQEEEVGITRREKAKPKQEPVIKGLLPETPAPQAVPRAEPRQPSTVAAPPVAVRPIAPSVAPRAEPAGRACCRRRRSVQAAPMRRLGPSARRAVKKAANALKAPTTPVAE